MIRKRERDSYLCGNVVVRWRAHDGEADEEDISLGIGQGPESVIIFLACRIPKTQTDGFAINNDASRVVVKPNKQKSTADSNHSDSSPSFPTRNERLTLSGYTLRGRHWSCTR